MCSNEDILDLPLANLDFQIYVRGGWWVGDATQNNVRARSVFCAIGTALKYQSSRITRKVWPPRKSRFINAPHKLINAPHKLAS